jgi:hypothetical protein
MIREPIIHSRNTSFETVLDDAFDRLLDKKAQYAIARLVQMEADLTAMEESLDAVLRDWTHGD